MLEHTCAVPGQEGLAPVVGETIRRAARFPTAGKRSSLRVCALTVLQRQTLLPGIALAGCGILAHPHHVTVIVDVEFIRPALQPPGQLVLRLQELVNHEVAHALTGACELMLA